MTIAATGVIASGTRRRFDSAPAAAEAADTNTNTGCVKRPKRCAPTRGTAALTAGIVSFTRSAAHSVIAANSAASAYGRAVAAGSSPNGTLQATRIAVNHAARAEAACFAASALNTIAPANAAADIARSANADAPNTRVQASSSA